MIGSAAKAGRFKRLFSTVPESVDFVPVVKQPSAGLRIMGGAQCYTFLREKKMT